MSIEKWTIGDSTCGWSLDPHVKVSFGFRKSTMFTLKCEFEALDFFLNLDQNSHIQLSFYCCDSRFQNRFYTFMLVVC